MLFKGRLGTGSQILLRFSLASLSHSTTAAAAIKSTIIFEQPCKQRCDDENSNVAYIMFIRRYPQAANNTLMSHPRLGQLLD